MTNVVMPTDGQAIMERVLTAGDVSKLTIEERNKYLLAVCQSLGLNPLTRPFQYVNLGGRLVLYATKDCTDQLRKLNSISISITNYAMADGVYSVTVRATEKDTGRTDEDIGAVACGHLKGEFLANAHLKAITKAKRRVTLSICGLGFPDESDIEDELRRRRRAPIDHTRPQPKQEPLPPPGVADEIAEVEADFKAAEHRIEVEHKVYVAEPGTAPMAEPNDPTTMVVPEMRFALTRLSGEVTDAKDFDDWHLKMLAAVARYSGEQLRKLSALNHDMTQRLAEFWPDEIDDLEARIKAKLEAPPQ